LIEANPGDIGLLSFDFIALFGRPDLLVASVNSVETFLREDLFTESLVDDGLRSIEPFSYKNGTIEDVVVELLVELCVSQ